MKKCSVCDQEKSFDKYYKGYAMCKSCHYDRIKIYRESELGKAVRQKERRAAKESGKYKQWQTKYENSDKGRERNKRYEQTRYESIEGKARLAAKNAVKYAIKTGKLIKQPCFMCGEIKTHAHHSSYAKDMRLSVTWLCHAHHNQIHNFVKEKDYERLHS